MSSAPPNPPNLKEAADLIQVFLNSQFGGEKKSNGIVFLALSSLGVISAALGLFIVLVPVTYSMGGYILYKDHGWRQFQPGVGGQRFVALNGLAWTLYASNILLTVTNFFLHDLLLQFASFGVGMLSYSMMVSSLLIYQNDKTTRSRAMVSVPANSVLEEKTFNFELEELLHNGEHPTTMWWLFIVMNTFGAMLACWIALAADFHFRFPLLRILANVSSLSLMAACTAMTHALGGQWRHLGSNFKSFQPGKGGARFVAMQAVGWILFSISLLLAVVALFVTGKFLLSVSGVLGLIGQVLIGSSLFYYDSGNKEEMPTSVAQISRKSAWLRFLQRTKFLGLNIVFAQGTTYENSRFPSLKTSQDHLLGEQKFQELTKLCVATNQQYLIIGVGFVGKRLVKRLLERGETKIRLFDIVPTNPFSGDSRVEYIRGDVTKYEDVRSACVGVNVVYSTFAIIRFMDRLEHQAALSYRINVLGSENVLKACREENVDIVVVTSSSHATTDEHSQPRLLRDESSPYVVRETAHNHYGWTKAAADLLCLKANGSIKKDNTKLRVSIVRPCSGVFGGDDRISFEKAMDLTTYPGLGAKRIMDWVYVENVVLGHLLLENAMQRQVEGVDGEAFNISNNEACRNEDFWFSVVKTIDMYCDKDKIKSNLDFVFIPESPLWAISYLSELNQKIFKGRVSLGRDLDMLTPGAMATATMEYSYNSDKAKQILGYEPAYTVDQAIQRSLYDYWATKFPEQS